MSKSNGSMTPHDHNIEEYHLTPVVPSNPDEGMISEEFEATRNTKLRKK
jgi:hypothetical protein